jgi:E3 ubiquitin-protein ligase RAD18
MLLDLVRNRPFPTSQVAPPASLQNKQIEDVEPPVVEIVRTVRTSEQAILCPICDHPFETVEQVDGHIDNCTGQPSHSSSQLYNLRPQRSNIRSSQNGPSLPPKSAIHIPTSAPLPKVNYAIHNDKSLRTLLSDLGLPAWGSKSLMSARHKEFVNLHNANIDRRQPRSKKELLRELEKWDETQHTLTRGVKRKELNGEEWGKKCQDDFVELARQARETAKKRKVQAQSGEGINEDIHEEKQGKMLLSSQEETVA